MEYLKYRCSKMKEPILIFPIDGFNLAELVPPYYTDTYHALNFHTSTTIKKAGVDPIFLLKENSTYADLLGNGNQMTFATIQF